MLTYSGNDSFTVLESTAKSNEELVIKEVNGEIEKLGYHIKLRNDDEAYEGTIYVAPYKEDK